MTSHAFTPDEMGDCIHCPLPQAHPRHTPPPPPPSPVEMNAVGSPTGRVRSGSSETSVNAAIRTDGKGHRAIILTALRAAGSAGLTSIEAAAALPLTAQGAPQVSNRSASRLGELWEAGEAAILRERGTCTIGVCLPHQKPEAPHRPTAACSAHGKARTRDGASIWVALTRSADPQPEETLL